MTEYDGVERSTATETFRAKLNERNVEWVGTDFTEPTKGHATNTSLGSEYHDAVFIEYVDGTVLRLFDLTPEQAVEATLGRGTCVNDAPEPYYFACSSCGTCLNWNPNFCPYCGAKVVDE